MVYSNWPDDLITEILVRLPVKSLLRFKCVHKNWYSLITSSFFVRKHLHHKENPTHLLIPIYGEDVISQTGTTIYVLPDKILPGLIPEKPSHSQIPVQLNQFIGRVDGLFFLLNISYQSHVNDSHRMALWNPATREFRPLQLNLPKFTQSYFRYYDSVFGFGFDPISQDYKVVCIWFLSDQDASIPYVWFAAVYSLDNDCWKKITCNFDADLLMHRSIMSSTCFNGFYYWCANITVTVSHNTYKQILLIRFFDMHNEVLGEFSWPNHIPAFDLCDLTIYKESLCLLVRHLDLDDDHNNNYSDPPIDIWVMKDERLWIKVLNVVPTRTELLNVVPTISECQPIGFWGHDKFIFSRHENIMLYDSKTHEFTHLLDKNEERCYTSVFNYRESLVFIEWENVCHRQGDVLDLIQDFFLR
nr:putative F-box protein At5g62660 [Nicotiana tomentosiformis]